MGSYEQWGDKASDFEEENNRFNSDISSSTNYSRNRSIRSNRSYRSKKKSGGFIDLVLRTIFFLFVIWFILSILK
ncbi:hypothetical protein M0D21_00795 [Aquimarina sp. D1M17]|uniref:hypothetical protein n=1 Tax=Aquimarina acroporae TaxID=2937283 RepID=UPI0020C0BD35|nr:hypothetical protein [Aquimarina acroporae]MCK8520087.1 hypothetical protein [Aquimarina acroporae]